MPSASQDLRDLMLARFGSEIDESGPMKFLEDAGYTLTEDWHWDPKPGIKGAYANMTRDEFDCLLFLVHEWDFGGLTSEP